MPGLYFFSTTNYFQVTAIFSSAHLLYLLQTCDTCCFSLECYLRVSEFSEFLTIYMESSPSLKPGHCYSHVMWAHDCVERMCVNMLNNLKTSTEMPKMWIIVWLDQNLQSIDSTTFTLLHLLHDLCPSLLHLSPIANHYNHSLPNSLNSIAFSLFYLLVRTKSLALSMIPST